MKRLALVLLFVVAAAPAVYAQNQFVANLSGLNEVPPADLDGNGTALVTITGTTVSYEIVVNNISAPTAQHIHIGPAGVNGPIVVNLPGTWTGSGNGPWTLVGNTTTDLATASSIIATPSGFYVNVHNADFPGGAVRGQLAAFTGNIPTVSTMGIFALIAAMAIAGLLVMRRV